MNIIMEDVRSFRYGCLVWYIVTVCGVLAGYTTNGNNVTGIHIEMNARLPYYVHFLFCRVQKMLL